MPTDTQAILILGLAFLCAVLLIEGIYYVWKSARMGGSSQAKKRLRRLSAAGVGGRDIPSLLRHEVLSSNPVLNSIYLSVPRFHYIDRMLERAAPNITLSRYLLICLGFAVVVFVVAVLLVGTSGALGFLVAFLSALFLPYLVLCHFAEKYVRQFNGQLPDAIDFIGRSLRAGNPFSASLKAVSDDMADPIASEFGATFDEMRYGVDVDQALLHLVERTGSDEVKFFATAVMVQRTTGGNLAKVLDRLSAVMRARANTRREIIVLSTEMRYSANILIALPFFVAGAVTLVDPGYLAELFISATGLMLVAIQFVLIGIGYYIIRKMINFRI